MWILRKSESLQPSMTLRFLKVLLESPSKTLKGPNKSFLSFWQCLAGWSREGVTRGFCFLEKDKILMVQVK